MESGARRGKVAVPIVGMVAGAAINSAVIVVLMALDRAGLPSGLSAAEAQYAFGSVGIVGVALVGGIAGVATGAAFSGRAVGIRGVSGLLPVVLAITVTTYVLVVVLTCLLGMALSVVADPNTCDQFTRVCGWAMVWQEGVFFALLVVALNAPLAVLILPGVFVWLLVMRLLFDRAPNVAAAPEAMPVWPVPSVTWPAREERSVSVVALASGESVSSVEIRLFGVAFALAIAALSGLAEVACSPGQSLDKWISSSAIWAAAAGASAGFLALDAVGTRQMLKPVALMTMLTYVLIAVIGVALTIVDPANAGSSQIVLVIFIIPLALLSSLPFDAILIAFATVWVWLIRRVFRLNPDSYMA
jgi:hypothetical protein